MSTAIIAGVRGTTTASASRSCSKNTDLWGLRFIILIFLLFLKICPVAARRFNTVQDIDIKKGGLSADSEDVEISDQELAERMDRCAPWAEPLAVIFAMKVEMARSRAGNINLNL